MLKYVKTFALTTILVLSVFNPMPAEVYATSLEQSLILSEIKVKNDSSGLNEFIELYNNSSEAIQLSGFLLVYFNIHSPTSSTIPTSTQVLTVDATQMLEPYQFYVLARTLSLTSQPNEVQLSLSSGLKDGEGLVRLVGPDSLDPLQTKIYDEIAWVDSSLPPVDVQQVPTYTQSLQRISYQATTPVVFEPDWVSATPTPFTFSYVDPVPLDDIEEDEALDEEVEPQLTCEGIVINELLPNPAGADTSKEFIELYNPTAEVITLDDCELKTTANTKVFQLEGITLQPGEYLALYDSQTGLTLANASGGTVWLLSTTQELQAITYDGGTPDDVAWALIEGIWEATYQPTPNGLNILLASKPCPAGQIRSLETGRCQNITTPEAITLTPCQPGQERNPATNRCRAIFAAVASLVPCREGQERNPDTNRCRNIATTSSLVPCAEGQERNPETNRCRKISSIESQALTVVKDVNTGPPTSSPKWWLAGVTAFAAIFYGLYEWRHDLTNLLERLKSNPRFHVSGK